MIRSSRCRRSHRGRRRRVNRRGRCRRSRGRRRRVNLRSRCRRSHRGRRRRVNRRSRWSSRRRRSSYRTPGAGRGSLPWTSWLTWSVERRVAEKVRPQNPLLDCVGPKGWADRRPRRRVWFFIKVHHVWGCVAVAARHC